MPSPNADTKFVLSTYTQNLCVNLFFKVCTYMYSNFFEYPQISQFMYLVKSHFECA